MKKTILLITFISLALASQAQQKAQKPATAKPQIQLASPADTLQYSLGAYLGQYINNNGFAITNADLFIKGMNDAMANKALMVDAKTISSKISQYQSQTAIERAKILEKKLFESVKVQPNVGILPSGVCYSIIKAAKGLRPQLNDSVQLQLKGYLPDGTLFEDTYVKNKPYNVTSAGLLAGLSEVVQIMPEGSLWKVFIPSEQAFGEKGIQGLVPPFSAVIFEVELIKIKK